MTPAPFVHPVEISVVLPVFRATGLAIRSVEHLAHVLEREGYDWEIVVVDDGPYAIPSDTWAASERVRLVQHAANRGKGAAVRTGMLAARGRARIFTDVDLPYGTALLGPMARLIRDYGFHLVIGDRTLPASSYHELQSWTRRAASRLFSSFVGRLVTGGFFDTQCGLKAMRGDVANILLPLIRTERFAFDVELVYLALKFRLDIKRVPVRLEENQASSVRVVRDGFAALRDVLRMKWIQLRGGYASEPLERLVTDDFERVVRGGPDTAAEGSVSRPDRGASIRTNPANRT
jgi:dolichyl-phosphate beta-glucosyltransferase